VTEETPPLSSYVTMQLAGRPTVGARKWINELIITSHGLDRTHRFNYPFLTTWDRVRKNHPTPWSLLDIFQFEELWELRMNEVQAFVLVDFDKAYSAEEIRDFELKIRPFYGTDICVYDIFLNHSV
jgi:hypothetical protein